MTNAELIQKIRNEIERRYKEFDGKTGDIATASRLAYLDVISFLSTLEESEKPMNQEGLEEEYKDYVERDPVYSKLVNRIAGLDIARHFAQWGAEHSGSSEIPNDLEEAADNFANQDCVTFISRKKGFIAGAKWQKEQMLKEAKR